MKFWMEEPPKVIVEAQRIKLADTEGSLSLERFYGSLGL